MNLRTSEEVELLMREHGFHSLEDKTAELRAAATLPLDPESGFWEVLRGGPHSRGMAGSNYWLWTSIQRCIN